MKPDQSIEIQLVNGSGQPLRVGNVMVQVHFFTLGNFRYEFGAGRTDEAGRATISYADMEERRRENAEFWLMDYNTKLDDCDPRVKIVILSEQQLRERHDGALRTFKAPPPWAKNWPSNGQIKPQEKSVELAGGVTRVEIPTERVKGSN